VKRWNFRKADWNRFCLLTGESIKRLPPLDTPNIERAYQDFCKSLLSAAKQCIPRGSRKSCAMLGQSVSPSITPLIEPQWALTLTEPLCPYYLDYNISSMSNGRKLSTPSTSHTLDTRRGEQSTNLLAGLDAPLTCATSKQILFASQLVKNGAHRTGGHEYTRLVKKQLSNLWKNPPPKGHSFSKPFRPEEFAAALRRLKPGKSPPSQSLYSMLGQLSNLGFATFSLPPC